MRHLGYFETVSKQERHMRPPLKLHGEFYRAAYHIHGMGLAAAADTVVNHQFATVYL